MRTTDKIFPEEEKTHKQKFHLVFNQYTPVF